MPVTKLLSGYTDILPIKGIIVSEDGPAISQHNFVRDDVVAGRSPRGQSSMS